MRVIAGDAKGRKLAPVPGDGTRPITARVKSALFSILGADIVEATMLDLFAGTGAVGIEALSRGAERVVFIERAIKAVRVIKQNLETTRLTDWGEVVHTDAFRYLAQLGDDDEFDYIYVAPPQYQDLWAKALLEIDANPHISAFGQVIVQIHPKEYAPVTLQNLELVDQRNYGSTLLHFYQLKDDYLAAEEDKDPGEGQAAEEDQATEEDQA